MNGTIRDANAYDENIIALFILYNSFKRFSYVIIIIYYVHNCVAPVINVLNCKNTLAQFACIV